jgi:uncharacterized protein YceK
MKKITLNAFICSLLLIGCGKVNSSSNQSGQDINQQATKTVDLSDKTTAEILALKYNKAVLTCSLWSQRGKNIHLEVPPNDSASLDLKKDLATPQILELNASLQDHQIKVTLEVVSISHYGLLNHTESKGNQVVAKYSPYVKMNYTHLSQTFFGDGQSSSVRGSTVRTVNERIEDLALNESVSSKPVEQNGASIDKGALNDYVRCSIETDIKSEYADQFSYTPEK